MKWMTGIVAAIWIGIAPGAGISAELSEARLTVIGEGRIDSAPDMATITVGVMSEAKTAANALDKTSAATAKIIEEMTKAGIAARDMQTRDLALQPVWDNRNSGSNQPPRIAGYRASNTVAVRVRALDGLGAVLDKVVESGGNTFHGLSFGLQRPGPVQDAARRDAVVDAMRKAKLYADAAGLTLGAVLELSEAGQASPQPVMMERMAMMSDAVPVAGGEVSVNARVTMVFAINP